MNDSRGFSLLELLVVLAILAILLGIALPPTARWRDELAVRAAREELAAGVAWTRLAAAAGGGGRMVLDPVRDRFWTATTARGAEPPVDLRDRYGVRLDVGREDVVALRFDALGIGRIASRRLRVTRGGAEAGIIVSSYGRVRRW